MSYFELALQIIGSRPSSPQSNKEFARPQFGLKVLAAGENPDVDIVAIHGVDGDRENSWRADNNVLWLKDLLPAKIPNARILTYGYDASTHGQEQLAAEFMHEHAMNFISKLALFREETETTERAIIFVAHSSGGILLKSALIHSHLSHDGHLKHHHAISLFTHGVTFFSTPHQGLATAELARFLLDIWSPYATASNVLLRHLEKESESLQQQLVQYSAISSQFETKFFYELHDTRIVGKLFKRVVPRSSAVLPGAVNMEAIGISKDHVNIVKFPSADDEDFRIVSTVLSLMSKAASQNTLEYYKRKSVDTSNTKKSILTTSQKFALSTLPRANAARFEADSRHGCLKGTRVDLLEKISLWGNSGEHCRIFWLCGQAGTGKTTISLTVASDCQAQGHLGASFFFSRDDAERNDLRLVFPTLANQLGLFHRPFQMSLAEALEKDPDFIHTSIVWQFKNLIVEPLKSCSSFPAPTIIVIDALDECKNDERTSKMLSIISAHLHDLPQLKFFITSRPEDHIWRTFQGLTASTQKFSLHDIEPSIIDADIQLYLRHELSIAYPGLAKSAWASDDAVQSLVKKSGRLFIFAATAINFILEHPNSDPSNQLDHLAEFPASEASSSSPVAVLGRLYIQVLQKAFLSNAKVEKLKKLLGTIIFLRDPPSSEIIESLLDLPRGTIRDTLCQLHSIMYLPDGGDRPIRPIHPSFFEFIISRCSDPKFQIDPFTSHERLAIACFEQMKGLKHKICKLQDIPKVNAEENPTKRIERYISPAMRYACFHWTYHVCNSGENANQGPLKEFCGGHILYWMQVLSALGCLGEGILQLQAVGKFLNKISSPSKDLLMILNVGARSAFWQLHRSALTHFPPSNFLRMSLHNEFNGGMRISQDDRGQVALLSGLGVTSTSVDFSPDGMLIVSASHDEIQLWDRNTGMLVKRLKADINSFIRWARCFPDGSRVICGTSESAIRIWNITCGASFQTIQLEGADSDPEIMACYGCSPDVTHIAGSKGNSILLWDASNGSLVNLLKGHSKNVQMVIFSPNLAFIASTSWDHTVRLWHTHGGAAIRTLPRHSGNVATIAFSPNSKYIISNSWDIDIRLWDVDTDFTKTLIGHTETVNSVAFSPDSAHIISGSNDRSIRVWDAVRGNQLSIIRCSAFINNVSFSPDGTQYLSSQHDTIYLCDVDRRP